MEWSILFLGAVGAGKTQAIKTVSDIEVVNTEVDATDETRQLKRQTTVAMDVGVLKLGNKERVVLYGAPGQARFDFMWEILWDQVKGVVVLLDHRSADSPDYLEAMLMKIRSLSRFAFKPVVIGVTHLDECPVRPLDVYTPVLQRSRNQFGVMPLLALDARSSLDVKRVLLSLTAMLDMLERFPKTQR